MNKCNAKIPALMCELQMATGINTEGYTIAFEPCDPQKPLEVIRPQVCSRGYGMGGMADSLPDYYKMTAIKRDKSLHTCDVINIAMKNQRHSLKQPFVEGPITITQIRGASCLAGSKILSGGNLIGSALILYPNDSTSALFDRLLLLWSGIPVFSSYH